MKHAQPLIFKQKGSFLLELIIVLGILAIFFAVTVSVFNPTTQFNKAYDAQRLEDLSSVASALGAYYNDKGCYPVNVPFGQTWSNGGDVVYMSKVPTDPNNGIYIYLTDNNQCPQWAVVFGKLSNPANSNCKLPSQCQPLNYDPSWACRVSGVINCSIISQEVLPTPAVGNTLSPTITQTVFSPYSKTMVICHSAGGKYIPIQVSKNGSLDGHDSHANDIIPPFSYTCTGTCQYAGKNWTSSNQTIYNNGCK